MGSVSTNPSWQRRNNSSFRIFLMTFVAGVWFAGASVTLQATAQEIYTRQSAASPLYGGQNYTASDSHYALPTNETPIFAEPGQSNSSSAVPVVLDDSELRGESASEGEGAGAYEPFYGYGEEQEPEEEEFEIPLRAIYKDGFSLRSPDDQFQLRLKFLTQIDGKIFSPSDQEPARGGMYVPRFRTYFEGQLSDGYEYELSLQRSVEGAFDLLDANINFRPSEEFQIRVGRSLTPYSYTWYDHLEQFYITPERGLIPLNFGLARQAGVIFHGVIAEKLEYAAGVTFGHLAGLADRNTTREGVGYVNYRPFLNHSDDSFLKYLNLGGSLAIGRTQYATFPLPLRTSIQTSENDEAAQAASTQFLEFNEGVIWQGGRQQGALHIANYAGPWSLEAEVYALSFEAQPDEDSATVWVPAIGFDATASMFVTGERITGRTVVEPLRPWGEGWGACEVFGRYSYVNIDEKIFSAGFAEEDDWTRRVGMTDIGFNWYLNRFVKMTFDWQHAMFASPILLNEEKDKRGNKTDLYWLRCQLYF